VTERDRNDWRELTNLEGLEVGAYTLERPLGHGGMGSVWLAHRTDGRFEGRVAVKLMSPALLGSSGVERFRREGSLLARLAHPGIARLHDAGVAPTRQPYLVIEFIDGQPIDRFVADRSLSVEDRVRLVLQVLDALAHAHANLVIHRDIKPSNILVTADGVVKLLDFGIAKLLDATTGGGATELTVDGGRPFTPDFAAPEQFIGDPVTTATDVYSVGVLLYLLLAGRHPLAPEGAASPMAIFALGDREPRRLGLGDLDTVLAKALRRAPAERYQTAVELADDLRRFLEQQPVRARPSSAAYRARKFFQRHRAMVSIGLAALVVIIGTAVFAVVQMQVARTQRNEAIRSARRNLALSDLQGILASDARGPDGKPLAMAARIRLAERVLTNRFRGDPGLVAEVTVDLSGRFAETGDVEQQRAMLERARVIATNAKLPVEEALVRCTRAISYWLQDELDSARADVLAAKRAIGSFARPDTVAQGLCLEAEGKLLQATGRADSGIALLRRAVLMAEADSSGSRRLAAANALAEVLRLSGRAREAVPQFRRILAELDATGFGDTEAFPNVVGFLSASLAELGEFAALDSSLGGYVRDRERSGGGNVSSALALLYGYGKLRLGAVDSADRWIRALRDTTQGAGTLAIYLAQALAQLRLDQGRLAEAKAAVDQLPARARGQRATSMMVRARFLDARGDAAGAAALLERELGALWSDGKPRLAMFALPLVTAGEWRLARGDARGADSMARMAREAAAIDSIALGRSALVGRAELLRARALRSLGDRATAKLAAERAIAALGNGYGPGNQWTLAGKAVRDSLR
jgi:tetratricopeptide (TPR) repeat protein